MKAVLIAGGGGTRLWPLSRAQYPKQFLKLNGERSLLEQSLDRIKTLSIEKLMVVCSDRHRYLVSDAVQGAALSCEVEIILEPVGKNTAPATALAAFDCKGDDTLLVLPADHLIKDSEAFSEVVAVANQAASNGDLLTFGIVPDSPNTGYGYIKRGQILDIGYRVDKFVEKPDLATATNYLESGDYLWNSGMFVFTANAYLESLKKHRPDIHATVAKAVEGRRFEQECTIIPGELFEACPSESIDYAIMESTKEAVVLELDCGWSDVGTWKGLLESSEERDQEGNKVVGDVMARDVKNSYLNSEGRLLVAAGLEDVAITVTPDAVLAMHNQHGDSLRELISDLGLRGRDEIINHREVRRPWGTFDSILKGEQFQVKRITVNPGEKLSLQSHEHRDEHWVVVGGIASVTLGDELRTLQQNEHVFIPKGTIHSLENQHSTSLEIIEVQTGSYLGEDDIIRYEDKYGRA